MKSEIQIIHEGLTYEYVVHGLIVLIAGGLLFFVHYFFAITIILLGIALILVSTGIEIDTVNRRMRKYKSVFLFKTGVWKNLHTATQIELFYNANSVKTPDIGSLAFSPTYILPRPGAPAKTFDLFITIGNNKPDLINQFLKYGLAVKTLETLSKIPGLNIVNHYEITLLNSKKNRMSK